MQRRVGHVVIETVAGESQKFTAPMVLIHGLWCTGAAWRRFMGYCAHRGWVCHAMHLRGRGESTGDAVGTVRLADHRDDLRQVIASCDAPPVLIGHDLGGLLALLERPAARAVVAIAPLVPRSIAAVPNAALMRLRARWAIWRATALRPPRRGIAARYFGAAVPGGTVWDSGGVVRDLDDVSLRLERSPPSPALVIAGADDPFCPPSAAAALAAYVGASAWTIGGAGHAMPWDTGWEQRVGEIHRWLIHTLGDSLLALREEDEEDTA